MSDIIFTMKEHEVAFVELHISKDFSFLMNGHAPNRWYRFWQWLLLGWRWKVRND